MGGKRPRRLFDNDLACDEPILSTTSASTSSTYKSTTDTAYQADNDSKEFVLAGVPSSVKKTKEDSSPLPDPFPLPTNFRADVHVCLSKKKMTKSARASFFTAVAAAMFQYKRYPSRNDYVSVAR